MQYTENYSLRKPQAAETASYQDLNYNSDKIDGIMADNRQISLNMYVSGNTYNSGDIVGYENPSTHRIKAYKCNTDGTTGTWDSTKWDLTNLGTEIKLAVASGGDNANQNIADEYDPTESYVTDNYVIYNSLLYKCIGATTGAWDSTKWQSCVVTDEMGQGGTTVIANPSGTATDDLEKIQIGNDIYDIPSGGGGGNEQELTYAEYLALTDAQRLNGTNYFVTDINGDGSEFQPVIYSDAEREVGVWYDGKPLYQKTFYCNPKVSINSNSWGNIATISEVVNVIKAEAVNNDSGEYAYYSVAGACSSSKVLSVLNPRNNVNIQVEWVTFWYTKPTDTTGSGIWTPQGVPAHHYSTSEQVIGTWIDGSTLYEKTFTGSVTMPSNSWYDFTLDSGIDIVHVEDAKYIQSGGETVDMNWYRSSSIYSCYTVATNIISALQVGIANISGYRFVVQYTKSS